jgi:WD40 repeat protein/tRNA A-37 threonylcarbamoyl transferase component Bud32
MAMDEDLARRSHALLMKAVELDEPQRLAFIRDACQGDERLRARVSAMVDALKRSRDFLETPALAVPARGETKPARGGLETVGDYCVVRVIGTGGMATVYEAIQSQPRRRVALKLMKQGLEQTSAVHRFKFETEVLARLHHPGIAQIIEAGACDTGHGVSRPFFVMEFIAEARTITAYARERGLGLRDRLAMFVAVCDAVQHGHQLGVIHRDLKPGNILVDGAGRPKVIDFGVARSNDPAHAGLTQHGDLGQLIGTLNYMSPEQCTAGPIDIRTDVYSLGVVLYELLCNRLPHDLSRVPIPTALRMIQQDLPRRPVDIEEYVRGDLDAIVMMAIEKDPDRRYRTAAALGADVRRYLNHQPVEARPATLFYQCRMFARRNRALVGSIAVVLLATTAGAIVSTFFALHATRESNRRLQAEQTAIQERDTARRHAYLANIAAGFSALQSGEFQQIRSRLAGAPERLRGWEWGLLSGLSERSLQTIVAHEDMIFAFAGSRDGKRLATGCRDGSIRVWDAETGTCVTRIATDSTSPIHAIAFTCNGEWVVSGAEDGSVHLWDSHSGQLVRSLEKHRGRVRSVSCRPDGLIATAGQDGVARLWKDGEATPQRSLNGVHGLIYSEDGEILVTWNRRGAVWLRDRDGTSVRHRLAFGGSIDCATISDDQTLIAAGGGNGRIVVWNTSAGQVVYELNMPSSVSTARALAFSPDSELLISGQIQRGIVAWSMATGEKTELLRGHEEAVSGLIFAQDGRRFFSSSWDHTIRVWGLDVATRVDLVTTLSGHRGAVRAVCISPDSEVAASGGTDRTVRLWDPELGIPIGVLAGHRASIRSVCFSPDGSLIASGSYDKTVRVWKAATGEAEILDAGGSVWSVTFSPDGRLVAGTAGSNVRIWDLDSKVVFRDLVDHAARINHIRFSPDGKKLASVSRTGWVYLWEVESGQLLYKYEGHSADVFAVVFSHDGRLMYTGSRDQTVEIWDTASGRHEHCLGGHGQFVTCLSLSPDGTRLAAGSWFGEIVLWDPTTRDVVVSFRGHDSAIRSIEFAPNGRWLATASHDGTVRLFDNALPQERMRLRSTAQRHHREALALVGGLNHDSGSTAEVLDELARRENLNPGTRAWARKLIVQAALARVPSR